ncbi:sensor histidine kinase [Microbacterium aurantiacum]|uniref:sensor histidine kinase n=1 Tax=Microbacterium aurantiacum TaxID=162393 RepID=UPI001FE56B59|nr:HAMP domain-containing sensor histidine kinase [Microbacterium aurantiacum]
MTVGAVLVVGAALGLGSVAGVMILANSLTSGVAVALDGDLDTIGDRVEQGRPDLEGIGDDLLVRLAGASGIDVNEDEAAQLPELTEDRTERVVIDDDVYLAASEETEAGLLTVARPVDHVDEAVAAATGLLAVAVPLAVVLIGFVVWGVASRALRPVEHLRSQVDDIDAAGLDQRLEGSGAGDEVDRLAATMNRMLDRIEYAQRTQRQFVSDASHELRSPLATIRQHAELVSAYPESTSKEEFSEIVLHEGARMQELVEGLLLLARLDEHRAPRAMASVDLDDLALAEVRRLRGLGVQVDAGGISSGRVTGSEVLLARALRNLADNAARHARTGVILRVREDPPWVRVEVEDDGAGIAPEHRERVFERFSRLDEGRARDEGGSGLGLAIVREIALTHGGSVAVEEGPSGGARFVLLLPARSDHL